MTLVCLQPSGSVVIYPGHARRGEQTNKWGDHRDDSRREGEDEMDKQEGGGGGWINETSSAASKGMERERMKREKCVLDVKRERQIAWMIN